MGTAVESTAWIKRLIVVALVMVLPACQSTDTRQVGGLLGSIGGAIGGSYLGRYLGGGTAGSIAASVLGGVAGWYVGAGIGQHLGKDDQQRMVDASQRAFDTGQTQTFSNPNSGVKGRAEIVSSAQQNPECKTIRQTVVLKDGKIITDDVNNCK
jgi:surface antigen